MSSICNYLYYKFFTAIDFKIFTSIAREIYHLLIGLSSKMRNRKNYAFAQSKVDLRFTIPEHVTSKLTCIYCNIGLFSYVICNIS